MLDKFMHQCIIYAVVHCPHTDEPDCIKEKCGRKLFPPVGLCYVDLKNIEKYLEDGNEKHIKNLPTYNWARSLKAAGVNSVYRVRAFGNAVK